MNKKLKKIVVILNGPAGSGKDAIGESVFKLLNNKNIPVHKVSFKDTLFEVTAKAFGIDISNFHTDEFYGRLSKEEPKHNLKIDDNFFHNIKSLYKELNLNLGNKDENKQLQKILSVRALQDDSLSKYFKTCNINDEEFIGKELSPRQSLILLSEVFIKPIYGEDFFGVYTHNKLRKGINIITDGGFMEEIIPMLKDKNVEVKLTTILSHGFGQEKTTELKNFNGDSRNYFQLFLISYLSQSKEKEDVKFSKFLKAHYKDIISPEDIEKTILDNKDFIDSNSFNDKLELFKQITTMKINNDGQDSLEWIAKYITDVFKLDKPTYEHSKIKKSHSTSKNINKDFELV